MEAIYEFIEAGSSESAFAWFNGLAETIHSLERFPGRGAVIAEGKKLRNLLLAKNQTRTESSTPWINAKTP